ncbi:MAG: F-type H+-transporting ATPase subunit delta [Clostridia bacterium]|nr:F-type H+-transporting ATPase subunit delta [Clostridia bacterium]
MSNQAIARRYARALFEIAREKKLLDEFVANLEQIGKAIAEEDELRRVLYHQLIPIREKQKIVEAIFPDFNDLLKNFLNMTIAKGREKAIPEIVTEFRQLVDKENNILPVDVFSAVPLTDEVKAALKERLQAVTKQNIRLNNLVNPEILGGIIIRLGDRVLDASLKKKLELLALRLKKA